jgi:hypothetical protein
MAEAVDGMRVEAPMMVASASEVNFNMISVLFKFVMRSMAQLEAHNPRLLSGLLTGSDVGWTHGGRKVQRNSNKYLSLRKLDKICYEQGWEMQGRAARSA